MARALTQRELEILELMNEGYVPPVTRNNRNRARTPVRRAPAPETVPETVPEPVHMPRIVRVDEPPVSVQKGEIPIGLRFSKPVKISIILGLLVVAIAVTAFNVIVPQSEKEIRDAVRSELVCMNAFGQLVDLCDARDAYMAAPIEQKKEAIQKVCSECPISEGAKSVCDQIPTEPFLEGIIVLGCNTPEKQESVPFWAFWRTQTRKISPPMVTGPACTNFRASSRECTETFHRNVEKARKAQTDLAKKSIIHASPIWIPGIIQIPVITMFESAFSHNATEFFSIKNMWLQTLTTPMCALVPSAIDIKNECIVMSLLWVFCTSLGHIAYSEESIATLNLFYKFCIIGLIAGIFCFLYALHVLKKYIKNTLVNIWGYEIMDVAVPIASFALWSCSGACLFFLYR